MKILLGILLIVCLHTTAQSQESTDFPHWLEGTWKINYEDGTSFEQWVKTNNETLEGRTFRIFNSDTIVFGTMKIKNNNTGILFYLYEPFSENGKYVPYKLIRKTPELWAFENPEAGFPQIINYLRTDATSVHVWTEPVNEKTFCMDFLMIKKDE